MISYEPNEDDLRTFRANEITDTISYRFSEDIESFSSYSGDVPYLDFTSLYYQQEINKYYSEFENILDAYNKIKVDINLSVVDLYKLDFFTLKYFNQFGKYYYLNKVTNFKKDKLTTCEFVEVKEHFFIGSLIEGTAAGTSTASGSLALIDADDLEGLAEGSAVIGGYLETI